LFPVEWGIFAFSSIIIVNQQIFFRTPLDKSRLMLFGEAATQTETENLASSQQPPLSSSRGVLKWCSLLKKRLAIIPTSARGPVEIGKNASLVGWDFVEMSRKKKNSR
jgi:hypothetical protein